MSLVPISIDELEMVVSECSRDLLEKWAIESEIQDDEMSEYAALSVETVAFVVEKFMGYMNDIMDQRDPNGF